VSASIEKRKIGLFGGTFDPVHKGHLAVARGVMVRYGLDECIFIPAPYPPHKTKPQTEFRHRVAMLERVLAGEPRISISLIESERRAPSYTVQTLREIHERIGRHKYHLVIGADSFVEVHKWYRYEEMFQLTDIIVAARPGIDREVINRQVKNLPGRFLESPDEAMWVRDDGFHIYYFADIHVDLSSSEIRDRLARRMDVEDLLPPEVIAYIKRHKLYTPAD